jgi:hypothetical protein
VPDLLGSAGCEGSASVRCRRRIAASSAIHSAVMSGRMPWLTKWTLARSWGPARLAALDRFLAKLVTLPYRERVARRWGQLQAAAQLRGRPRPANDTWIATCCLVRDLPLATLNIKDYTDYAQHDDLRLIG